MASSVIDILHSLGLNEDSELWELLYKLEDYNLVTTEELRNIQNISVKPLPSIVRNQADALKQRMYGIATDEDYGLPIVINRRIVLIKYILSILKNRIDDLNTELTNEVARLDTNISTKAENSYVNQLKNNVESMFAQLNNTKVDKVNGKQLSTNDLTNELLSKLNSLYNYDDTEIQKQIDEIKVILTSNDVDFDTLQELVNALKNNTSSISDIFTALSKKANKADIPTKLSQLTNDNNYIDRQYVDDEIYYLKNYVDGRETMVYDELNTRFEMVYNELNKYSSKQYVDNLISTLNNKIIALTTRVAQLESGITNPTNTITFTDEEGNTSNVVFVDENGNESQVIYEEEINNGN